MQTAQDSDSGIEARFASEPSAGYQQHPGGRRGDGHLHLLQTASLHPLPAPGYKNLNPDRGPGGIGCPFRSPPRNNADKLRSVSWFRENLRRLVITDPVQNSPLNLPPF